MFHFRKNAVLIASRTAFRMKYQTYKRKLSSNFVQGTPASSSNQQSKWYIYFRRALRAVQVTIISVSIFSTGYSYGLTQYASNPKEMDELLLKQAIVSMSSNKDITDSYHKPNTPEYHRVKQIS